MISRRCMYVCGCDTVGDRYMEKVFLLVIFTTSFRKVLRLDTYGCFMCGWKYARALLYCIWFTVGDQSIGCFAVLTSTWMDLLRVDLVCRVI